MQSPLAEDTLSPSLAGDEMQRNMDLIRELLLKLEALPMRRGGVVTITPDDEDVAVHGYDPDQIDYHLSQIRKKGFIDEGGNHPMVGIGFSLPDASRARLFGFRPRSRDLGEN